MHDKNIDLDEVGRYIQQSSVGAKQPIYTKYLYLRNIVKYTVYAFALICI